MFFIGDENGGIRNLHVSSGKVSHEYSNKGGEVKDIIIDYFNACIAI